MSTFTGRKAPNVSQYLANLNAIPSAHEIANQQQEPYAIDDELALFTNTEFYDFDLEHIEHNPVEYDHSHEERSRSEHAGTHKSNQKPLEFVNGDYQFPGMTHFVPAEGAAGPPPAHTNYPPPTNYTSPNTPYSAHPTTGDKRPIGSISLSPASGNFEGNFEDASRHAAEEDKRRRNTAASARFRVKKKQREQALEKTAKEMSDKASALEARIGQLQMENRWLRNLVTEKTGKDDVAELWSKFSKENEAARSTETLKKGVGTVVAKAEDVEEEEM